MAKRDQASSRKANHRMKQEMQKVETELKKIDARAEYIRKTIAEGTEKSLLGLQDENSRLNTAFEKGHVLKSSGSQPHNALFDGEKLSRQFVDDMFQYYRQGIVFNKNEIRKQTKEFTRSFNKAINSLIGSINNVHGKDSADRAEVISRTRRHELMIYALAGRINEYSPSNKPAWATGDIEVYADRKIRDYFSKAGKDYKDSDFSTYGIQLKSSGGIISAGYDEKKAMNDYKRIKQEFKKLGRSDRELGNLSKRLTAAVVDIDSILQRVIDKHGEENEKELMKRILKEYAKMNAAKYMLFGFSYANQYTNIKGNTVSGDQMFNVSVPMNKLFAFRGANPSMFSLKKLSEKQRKKGASGSHVVVFDKNKASVADIFNSYAGRSKDFAIHGAVPDMFYISRDRHLSRARSLRYTAGVESNPAFESIHLQLFGDYRTSSF